jgi:hypothetical protein
MKVRELVQRLQGLPDQDATVVLADGGHPLVWLIVTGIVERRIDRSEEHPDFAIPGSQCGYEIV